MEAKTKMAAASKSSILIFEMNKKYLVYKILTKELKSHLKEEIWKNFGAKYVKEKNEQNSEFYGKAATANESENSADTREAAAAETATGPANFNLTDDLIYEYFSALVASYEIAKEISYVYQYALFNRNRYIIRFHEHKNFLILVVFNASFDCSSQFRSQLYAEYYTSWFAKSIISLLKYKFGISTDDRCFKESDESPVEIKSLFTRWNKYFFSENLYFLEAIENLEVNDEILKKCEQLIAELADCFEKAENMWTELDEQQSSANEAEEDFLFGGGDDDHLPTASSRQRSSIESAEFERFFAHDLNLVNQFVLSYGGRLLYKSSALLDSASLFMLLLESAHFLDYRYNSEDSLDEFGDYNDGYDYEDEDEFESASSNSRVESAIDEVEATHTICVSNANEVPRVESMPMPKPSYSETYAESFQSVMSTPFSFIGNSHYKHDDSESKHGRPSDLETNKSSSIHHKRVKISNCFLHTTNRTSVSLYETLFFKLADNLCLILLKPSRFAKYCELFADFHTLLGEFAEHVKKRKQEVETQSKQQQPKQLNSGEENEKKLRLSKAFYGFFMNKLISLYDKLKTLKCELNMKSMLSRAESNKSSSFFSRALSLNANHKMSQSSAAMTNLDDEANSAKNQTNFSLNSTNLDKSGTIKLINTLQVKLNQFTSSKQFKSFINGINVNSSQATPEPASSQAQPESEEADMRYIEAQLSAIRTNLNDLFYNLFVAKSVAQQSRQQETTSGTKSTSRRSNSKGDFVLRPKSQFIFERLEALYSKHLYHYSPYMEIKLKRNISMGYYSYLFQGLVHFSFINRQDSTCLIPTIESALSYNLTEAKIMQIYRKYVPICMTMLFNFECSELRFCDDRLEVVFTYLIWFEDRKGNRIPVDFSRGGSGGARKATSPLGGVDARELSFSSKDDMNTKSQQQQQQQTFRLCTAPGITEKGGFYDKLKALCYPNAPDDSLICFELFCLHSSRLKEDKIDKQFKFLVTNLSKIIKT